MLTFKQHASGFIFVKTSAYGMSVDDLTKAAEALKELDGVNGVSKVFAVFNVQREGGTFGRYVDKFAAAAANK